MLTIKLVDYNISLGIHLPMRRLPLALAALALTTAAVAGEAPAPDKSGFTLFQPTPTALMR